MKRRQSLKATSAAFIQGGFDSGTVERYNGINIVKTPLGKCMVSDEVAETLLKYEPSIMAEILENAESFQVGTEFQVCERMDYPTRTWPYKRHKPEYMADVIYEIGDAASSPKAVALRNPLWERLSPLVED